MSDLLKPVSGQCAGKQGLETIGLQTNNALTERGYVISRVLIPKQNLTGGTLQLRVLVGHIGVIRSAPDNNIGWTRMMLPVGPGDLLNQRNLDQVLGSICRLPGQLQISFDIIPGEYVGESDIMPKLSTGKRWYVSLSADNMGSKSAGKYQMNDSLVISSPLHLYDQLPISASSNTDRNSTVAGVRSCSINWNVPVGYATFFAGASHSRYNQTVAGFKEPIVYSGNSSEVNTGISGVLHYDATPRTGAQFKLFRKINRNYLEDTEVTVQCHDVMDYKVPMSYRHYLSPVALNDGFTWRKMLPDHSNMPGVMIDNPGYGGRS